MFFNLHSVVELTTFWVIMSWLFLVLFVLLWSKMSRIVFPKYFFKFQFVWIIFLGLIIGSNYFSRVTYGIPTCIRLPNASDECMFSLDFPFKNSSISRYEREIDFNSSSSSQKWRLSGFNSLSYNVYGKSKSNSAIWEEYRLENKYPFTSSFYLNSQKIKLLREKSGSDSISFTIKYQGNVSIGNTNHGFSKEEKEIKIDNFSDDSLDLSFSNYECNNDKDNFLDCARSFNVNSISESEAKISLFINDNNTQKIVSTDFFQPKLFQLIGKFGYISLLIFFGIYICFLVSNAFIKSLSFIRHQISIRNIISDIFKIAINCSIAFVLLKIVGTGFLKFSKNAFALDNNMVIMKIAFFVLIIIYSSGIIRKLLQNLIKIGQSQSIIIFLWMFIVIFPSLLLVSPSLRDGTELYLVGHDQLTYFSWARDIAQNKTLFVEPTVVTSKPLFLYFKSLTMVAFGDGNIFLDTFSYWILQSSLLLFMSTALFCIFIYEKKTSVLETFTTVVLFSSVYWYLYLHVNSLFIRSMVPLSEVYTWPLALLAISWLALLPFIEKTKITLWFVVSGIIWAMTLMFRTPNLIYFVPYFMLIFLIRNKLEFKQIIRFLIPSGTALILIVLNAVMGGLNIGSAAQYYQSNTTAAMVSQSNIFENFKIMIPSGIDISVLVLFGIFLIQVFCSKKVRLSVKTVMFCLFIFFVFAHLPLVTTGYYPRGVMLAYIMLPVLVLIYWIQKPK